MADAANRLARSRLAIIEHIHRRQRRHDPREPGEAPQAAWGDEERPDEPPPAPGAGWLGRMRYAVRTWWRYHPAHMAAELAAPAVRAYARRQPAQLLALAALAGAALMFARPWRLISVTTVLVTVLKSSQLSSVLMSALSAADYERDHRRGL